MKNRNLFEQTQRIELLIKRADEATGKNIEMQSHWAKYVCIQVAGLAENAVKELFSEYVKRNANECVQKYAISRLNRIRNPKIAGLLETASLFSKTWGEQIEMYTASEGRKEAYDSIMANRHLIAHGKSSGITLSRVKDYYKKTKDTLEFLESNIS